ncbi:MAG TPA: hypothetical protein VHE35_07925 [Kofleriaceae bacterium]|nr:hypothetical protein [Kofleriaceae bacterium]
MQRWNLVGLAAVLGGALAPAAVAGPSAAPAPEIYPLSKVRPGQVGYGMTTFSGSTPERFEFEVVGVQRNFVPHQDIILVKSEDPKLAVLGFWRGMSGSPLYIEGKLACAFSYGFAFNKVALGGCTPLEYMKHEGLDTRRRSAPGAIAPISTMADWHEVTPTGSIDDLFGGPKGDWMLAMPRPAAPARPMADGAMTAAVPLALGGFTAPAFAEVEKLFADYPLAPMRTGGGGSAEDAGLGPTEFQMGASISVELIRGDMSAAATGTVSYVDGPSVLAFGHPLFQQGEFYAPVASAEVQTVIASAQFPFVIATPMRELGSLVQDRQSTIMADTRLKSRMVPVDIYINRKPIGGAADKVEFHCEVIDDKFLTPAMAGSAAMNAMTLYLPDRDHVTAKIDSLVELEGGGDLKFTDYLYAEDGAASIIGGVRGLRALGALSFNPFTPTKATRIRLDVDLSFAADYGEIKELRLRRNDLEVGRNQVDVVMNTAGGVEVVETVPFDVPASLAGTVVQVDVSAGDAARLDAAPPNDLPQLLAAFRRLLPGNVWAVTISAPGEGAAVDGIGVSDLPPSAQDKLHPGSSGQRVEAFRALSRSLAPSKRVLEGAASLVARVDLPKAAP